MKYINLIPGTNTVAEIIPGENPNLPGFSIEERYPPGFVAKLIAVDDDTEVEPNWVYNADSNTFSAPPAPEPLPEADTSAISDPPNPTLEARVAALETEIQALGSEYDTMLTGLEALNE